MGQPLRELVSPHTVTIHSGLHTQDSCWAQGQVSSRELLGRGWGGGWAAWSPPMTSSREHPLSAAG